MATTNTQQGVPGTPTSAIADQNGDVTPAWWAFFVALWRRTGGNSGSISNILDNITDIAGSLLFRAADEWLGLNPAAESEVLQMGAEFPEWGPLSGANFSGQAENLFFASPESGGTGLPAFRFVGSADLDSLAGQYPGTKGSTRAAAGNIGEYVFSEIASGAAVVLATGTPSDITEISLTAGDWDVWATLALSAEPTTANGWISTVSATDPTAPNSGAYAQWGTQTTVGPIGTMALRLGATTTVYLSTSATFAGSLGAYGFVGARRQH